MSRGPTDLPERLVAADATDFERRMIDAARDRRPSAASSARMARALGVTVAVTGAGAAAASKALAADAVASKATVAAGGSAVWPWVSAAVVGVALAGAVVGARIWHTPRPEPAGLPSPALAPTVPAAASPEPGAAATDRAPAAGAVVSEHRARVGQTGGDLREQIALLDSARQTLSAGSPQRALEILRRYEDRYPSGSFHPEAAATRIEALMKLGQESDARELARRFVAEHRGSLLAARVARLVGLAEGPGAP
jgi:hypothetical protein